MITSGPMRVRRMGSPLALSIAMLSGAGAGGFAIVWSATARVDGIAAAGTGVASTERGGVTSCIVGEVELLGVGVEVNFEVEVERVMTSSGPLSMISQAVPE